MVAPLRWFGVLLVLAVVAAFWLWPSAPPPAAPAPHIPRARLTPRAPAPALLSGLGLTTPDDQNVQILDKTDTELLILYPAGVDPITTAARWSLVLTDAGFRKSADRSRAGRTVLFFENEETSVLLAAGKTISGPFVLTVSPAVDDHWATLPDDQAPSILRPLIPPPEPPE